MQGQVHARHEAQHNVGVDDGDRLTAVHPPKFINMGVVRQKPMLLETDQRFVS